MSVVGTIILFRTISRGHDFGERLEPSSADAQCKRELTNDPEQIRMQECHTGIESMYMQCREAATLGEVEDSDQSAWATREVVFPPTRTTVQSSRD